MSNIWIDHDYADHAAGRVGFLVELRSRPAHTNKSHEPRLHGWCGTTDDVSTNAHGMAVVTRVAKNGRALIRRLQDEELAAALEAHGYPDLGEAA